MTIDIRGDSGEGPRTAFVLGGGGNPGAVQVGMIGALLELGVTPDLILGASAGALNGAAIASDPTPIVECQHVRMCKLPE